MAKITYQDEVIKSELNDGTAKIFDNPNLAFAYVDAYNWTFGELLKRWDGNHIIETVHVTPSMYDYVKKSDKYEWFNNNGKQFVVCKGKNFEETMKERKETL